MIRRYLLAAAGLSLALTAGCGTMMLTAIQEGEPIWLRHRLDWTVYEPTHRVALATLEVLRAELAEVKVVSDELTQDDRFNTADGKVPKPGEVKIPNDYPAFWVDALTDHPLIVNCRLCVFEGKTKDGKKVDVVVRLEIVGKSEQHTIVSVQIGHKRDDKATKELIDKISDRVILHSLNPSTPEERAALNAMFVLRPGTDDRKLVAAGEVRNRKN